MTRNRKISLSALLVASALTRILPAAPTDAGASTVVRALTAPSARRELAFNSIGIIAKITVKENDTVKAGQEIARQDDLMEQKRLEAYKLDADVVLNVQAEEKTRDNKKVTLDRKIKINEDSGRMNGSEVEEAQLDYDLSIIKVELAKREGRTKSAQVAMQEARLDQMKLLSPVDGVIEKLNLGEGEVADQGKPVVTVVRNDPLYIQVPQLSTEQVAKLKMGQELDVRYPGDKEWQKAKINFIAPVADAGSGTQSIRLEMTNPTGRSTGLDVEVRIAAATAEATAGAAAR